MFAVGFIVVFIVFTLVVVAVVTNRGERDRARGRRDKRWGLGSGGGDWTVDSGDRGSGWSPGGDAHGHHMGGGHGHHGSSGHDHHGGTSHGHHGCGGGHSGCGGGSSSSSSCGGGGCGGGN
ncbi:hypothetical protein ABZ412_09550 [Nocardia sp. NPDC005746]|uniref:hypothetical protein n=1 Tax=Nocardia sp. NPDC005746 TaxID=3157062 RepID=UPI0033C36AFB